MFRKVALTISYILTTVYILSILLPALYCYSHGCKGPDLDAFMPAFAFTPLGAITTAISLYDSIQRIRKGQSPWFFWPLAIIFSVVLLGVVALIFGIVYNTALHRR